MLGTTTISLLEELPSPLLTVYVNTQSSEPSAHGPSARNLTWLKQEAKRVTEHVPPRDQESFVQQVARTEDFLTERTPKEKALLILAGPTTWEVIPLRLQVEPELHWGRPALTQLEWILSENKRYCLVVLDRKGARLLDYGFAEMQELAQQRFEIDASQWKKKDLGHVTGQQVKKTRGSQRDTYQHRVDAHYQRFCREIAKQAANLFKANKCRAIFLVGSQELIKPVEENLPKPIRPWAVLVNEDWGKSPLPELQETLTSKIADWERASERAMVTKMLGDERKAVTGVDETLAQLQKRKLRTVVLARPLNGSAHECIECGWVDRSADPVCPVCGRERRAVELRDIVMEMAKTTNTDIEVVSGEAADRLNQSGGMTGWLRCRTQAELR